MRKTCTPSCSKLIGLRIGDSDSFITELWKVHLRVKEEGYVQVSAVLLGQSHKIMAAKQGYQNLSLGLFRSDYMVHQDTPESSPQIKQVEFNTIASSFGGLSAQTTLLHKYTLLPLYHVLSEAT